MSYIPSFFTRLDFWVLLLPGYIALIVGLFLLSPDVFNSSLIAGQEPTIFLIVVFIIAGPAIGLMLWQFYIQVASVGLFIIGHADKKYEFLREYSHLKACCIDKERAEIDVTEAQYQFGMSTAIALLIIAVLYLTTYLLKLFVHTGIGFNIFYIEPKSVIADIFLMISIFGVPVLLMSAAIVYNRRVRLPLICSFMTAYKGEVCSTQVCRRTKRWMDESKIKREKRAKKLYQNAKDKMNKIDVSKDKQVQSTVHLLEKALTMDEDLVKKELRIRTQLLKT